MAQLISGFHAVSEALSRIGNEIQEVWIVRGKENARISQVLDKARARGIPIVFKTRREMNDLLPQVAHQGFIAVAQDFKYKDLDTIITNAKSAENFGLIIAADHITDEGNLASLIRTCAFFGAHGLLIPKRRSARISYKVGKRSSGAHLLLPIAEVTNLSRALGLLSKEDFWIIGTSGSAPLTLYDFDWLRHVVLVVGNEQKGISESVKKQCHAIISIPSLHGVESLNVGVATGVVLSEIIRQRNFLGRA